MIENSCRTVDGVNGKLGFAYKESRGLGARNWEETGSKEQVGLREPVVLFYRGYAMMGLNLYFHQGPLGGYFSSILSCC